MGLAGIQKELINKNSNICRETSINPKKAN
jgi:hypothetical protein